jgi:ribosomal protein L11 methyltransferase
MPKARASAQKSALKTAPARLWEVSISTSVEAEDAVADLLHRVTLSPASSYHDLRKSRVRVSSHLPRLPHHRSNLRRQLLDGLEYIRACGLDTARARVTIRLLPPTDWAESWKRHFPALEVGSALLVRPEWIHRPPRSGQELIILDPGLSFGTGHHPTTKFCLRELVRARPRNTLKSMLDIGSGSGLLAIAAAKLGYRPVHAIDSDPVAVRISRANARRNQVGRSVHVVRADLKTLAEKLGTHDVVCANLQADLLLNHASAIARAVTSGGRLVLAGILRTELEQVRSTYESLQLQTLHTRHEKEWSSVSFRRR